MRRVVAVVVCLVCAGSIAACSDGGDELADPVVTSTTQVRQPSATGAADEADTTGAIDSTAPATTAAATSPPTSSPPSSAPTVTVVDVPETGVPGLDSDDVFCAAWSRFGGTWQVLLVGSTFLDDPQRVAEFELAAAPVVDDAFADLTRDFPPELAAEAQVVSDGYFGVLDRRSVAARDALVEAGADDEAIERLGRTWLDALASRDPATPDLEFEVPDDLRDLVDRAAADFRAQRVEFHIDPSMVVAVETPLTDDYLEVNCPDQGTLAGGEVDAG